MLASSTNSTPDAPATYRDAVRGANGKAWREACVEELQSLIDNKVYRMVDRPKHKKVIGVRWVLRVKVQYDGEVERYKGRVVAKGYSQREGIDYDETFATVVRHESPRLLFAYAASQGLVMQ